MPHYNTIYKSARKGFPSQVKLGFFVMKQLQEKQNYVPYYKRLRDQARINRKHQSLAEKIMWRYLRMRKFCGYKFHRQKPIGESIVDFYCPQLRLIVEVDGDVHFDFAERDEERTRILKKGYKLNIVRYRNEQVVHNIERVLRHLEKVCFILSARSEPSPRRRRGISLVREKVPGIKMSINQLVSPDKGNSLSNDREGVRNGEGSKRDESKKKTPVNHIPSSRIHGGCGRVSGA